MRRVVVGAGIFGCFFFPFDLGGEKGGEERGKEEGKRKRKRGPEGNQEIEVKWRMR